MMNSRHMRLIAAVSALALAASTAAGAQEVRLQLHHMLSNQSPAHTQMLIPWVERVHEATDGRVEIEVFPSMSLGGSPPDLIRQVRDGVVDIVWSVHGYTAGVFPRTEVFDLPLIHQGDAAVTNLAMRDLFDEYLAEEYEGLHVLWLHVHGGNGIQMASRAVRSPEDLEGLQIRTPTRTGAWTIEALGANAVSMPVPDLPQSLSRGVVDGAFIPWEIIPALSLQDLTDYQIEGADGFRMGTTTFFVAMNENSWNNLPEDIQEIILDLTGPDWWAEVGNIWMGQEEVGLGFALEAGNEHIVLTEEETQAFAERLESVVQRWIDEVTAQGIDGQALVDAAREAIARHAGTN